MEAVIDYKTLRVKKDQLLQALEMSTLFLEEDSMYHLNCKKTTKKKVLEILKKSPNLVDGNLFDELYKEVYNIMNDTVMRFHESKLYKEYIYNMNNNKLLSQKTDLLKLQKREMSFNNFSIEQLTNLSDKIAKIDWSNL